MLRKIIHIIVAVLLLLTTAGVTVSKHYCNKNMVSVSINSDAASCNHNDNCCHDSMDYFQVDDQFDLKESSNITDLTVQNSFLISAVNQLKTPQKLLQSFQTTINIPFPDRPDLAKLQRFLL